MTETRRGVELRAEPGRRLVGVVMKYGAEAHVTLPDGRAVVEKLCERSRSRTICARAKRAST